MSEQQPSNESDEALKGRITGRIDAIINLALGGGGGAAGVAGAMNGNHALFFATALM